MLEILGHFSEKHAVSIILLIPFLQSNCRIVPKSSKVTALKCSLITKYQYYFYISSYSLTPFHVIRISCYSSQVYAKLC